MKEIFVSLESLTVIHRELLTISKEKTEIIKDGAVDKLQALLINERKLVRKLETAEKERRELVEGWFAGNHLPAEEATVTNILEVLTAEEEKKSLEKVTIELTKAITELKAQEKLNLALINQSMQFVQVSLDLLSPTLKNMNYGNQTEVEQPNRSVFDSKA